MIVPRVLRPSHRLRCQSFPASGGAGLYVRQPDVWGRTPRLRLLFLSQRSCAYPHIPLPQSSMPSPRGPTGVRIPALALEKPCRRSKSHTPQGVAQVLMP